jgi:exoribonuclease II
MSSLHRGLNESTECTCWVLLYLRYFYKNQSNEQNFYTARIVPRMQTKMRVRLLHECKGGCVAVAAMRVSQAVVGEIVCTNSSTSGGIKPLSVRRTADRVPVRSLLEL